jgi:hypothetical protein
MIACIHDVDIIANAQAYERVESAPVIRVYSDLIGLPLPSSARIASMITVTGRVNVFAAVIGDDGCVIRSVLLPKELHRKAMGNEI